MSATAINPAFAIHAQTIKPEGPQPLLREIPLGATYPVASLGPLRAAVEAARGRTLAPPVALPAASALAVAALATQGHVDVETLGSPRPVSLYVLSIATSGERKSSCDELLMEGVLAFEKDAAKTHADGIAKWGNAHALWKGERDRILSDGRKGKGEKRTAAEADLLALGKEPTAPPNPGRIVGGQSAQGIVRQFREGMPTLGLFSDEGGKFLGGYAMNSENRMATMAALNGAWQGKDIRVSLAGEGSYVLYGRRLSSHLMVQPSVARTLLPDQMASDTGLLPRFLIADPQSTIGHRLQSAVVPDHQGILPSFAARLRHLLDRPLPIDPETQELKPRPFAAVTRSARPAFPFRRPRRGRTAARRRICQHHRLRIESGRASGPYRWGVDRLGRSGRA